MINRKGKYIRSWKDNYNHRLVHEYEYRGYKYEVTDPGWHGGDQPLSVQHEIEQNRIDDLIDIRNVKSKESSEIGLDLFFKYTE